VRRRKARSTKRPNGAAPQTLRLAGVVLAFLVVACDVDGLPSPPTSANTSPSTPETSLPAPDPNVPHSASPELDALAMACHNGNLRACDDLVVDSEPDSEHERYGATCGGRLSEPSGSCADVFAFHNVPGTTEPGPFSTNTSPRTGVGNGDALGALVSAQAAPHPGFDRFVLEFTDAGVPAYEVLYGEGIDGSHVLIIHTDPLLLGSEEGQTFDGPLRFEADTLNAAVFSYQEDEVRAWWEVSLRTDAGFEVLTLEDPARLVVDISHR